MRNHFFGIKYKKKNKYNTSWRQPTRFLNYPSAYLYGEEDCYLPIFVRTRKDLENFKSKYKTIGEFFDWIDRENKRQKMNGKLNKQIMLKNIQIGTNMITIITN